MYLPWPQTRCRCHGRELLYLVGTRLSLCAQFHLQHRVSDIRSAQESRSSVALIHPPPLPLGCGGVQRRERLIGTGIEKKKPRYLCHQLVAADNVQSVNDHAAALYTRIHTGSLSAEQVAEPAPCPRQHIFFSSSHLLFLF